LLGGVLRILTVAAEFLLTIESVDFLFMLAAALRLRPAVGGNSPCGRDEEFRRRSLRTLSLGKGED
jgi:hypothetical protein